MAKYKAKQIDEIEAEQFLPPLQIPKGVFNVYASPDGVVYSGQVWTIQGEKVNVKAGEWIVQEVDNPERYYPIADEVFKRKYELVYDVIQQNKQFLSAGICDTCSIPKMVNDGDGINEPYNPILYCHKMKREIYPELPEYRMVECQFYTCR